jgi:hypothetical protein
MERRSFKLSFRHGLAHRKELNGRDGVITLVPYDTARANEEVECGGSLFVMDTKGRIYAGTRDQTGLRHSSFLAGAPTLAAGGLRVVDGQVVWVSGRSGHYEPSVRQMVTLLERLRALQVDLSKVTVYRLHGRRQFPNRPPMGPSYEPCNALDMFQKRAWPTKEEPNSMFVM